MSKWAGFAVGLIIAMTIVLTVVKPFEAPPEAPASIIAESSAVPVKDISLPAVPESPRPPPSSQLPEAPELRAAPVLPAEPELSEAPKAAEVPQAADLAQAAVTAPAAAAAQVNESASPASAATESRFNAAIPDFQWDREPSSPPESVVTPLPEPDVQVVQPVPPGNVPPPQDKPPVPDRQWYAFWQPFTSELSARGFAARLERITGLDYRVVKTDVGQYHVAFGYDDDAGREQKLATIEAATGLNLRGDRL